MSAPGLVGGGGRAARHLARSASRPRSPRCAWGLSVSDVACLALATALGAFYLAAFLDVSAAYRAQGVDALGELGPSLALRALLFFLPALAFALLLLSDGARRAREALFRHRVLLGALVVVVATALELSGSSVARWGDILGADPVQGTLFGIPRLIRSDEYLANTPFAVSQVLAGFPATSEVMRGCATDVTVVYAQPAWAPSTLFRPFLWGYLLLGASRGLAFFWNARLVSLVLVSLELALLLSRGNRRASLAYALLVAFSPVLQWWFAINGLVEMLVFGQGLVLALHALVGAGRPAVRWALAGLMAWMAAGYVLVIYPAWQVPLFWVFAALGAGVVVERARERGDASPRPRELVAPLLAAVLLLVAFLALSLLPSLETIELVSGTAYPGARADVGGGAGAALFDWAASLFNALQASEAAPNACELTGFFSLFPAGLVVGAAALVGSLRRGERPDAVVVAALAVELLLVCYVALGLPGPLASLTLLSHSTSGRVVKVLGLLDLVVAVRSFGAARPRPGGEARLSPWGVALRLAPAAAFAAALALYARGAYDLRVGLCLVLFALFALLGYGVALAATGTGDATPLLAASLVVAVAGCCVNPLQRGIEALVGSPAYAAVQRVAQGDEGGLWAADDSMLGQLCVSAGAPCVNSLNTYPALERWRALDEEGESEGVYNRYAHISLVVDGDAGEPSFALTQPDSFTVTLTPDDLAELGVDYFVSRRSDLGDEAAGGGASLTLVEQAGPLFIWRVSP